MSDVPSGWYDDPEDPTQYRYWDGTQWTEHRAPRTTNSAANSSSAGSAAITDGWNLLRRNWVAMVVISLITLAAYVAAAIVIFIAANNSLEPSILDIVERVTEPGFDAVNDPADEAFIESIEFTPTAGFWVIVPVMIALVLIVQVFSVALQSVHVAADHVGRPRGLGGSFGIAMRRLPRWIGVYLLWALAGAVILAVFVGLAIVTGGLALILLIPGGIGAFIWLFPTLYLMGTALVVGPTGEPPFRTVLAMMRGNWRRLAWPVFLVNLMVIGISIGLSFLGVIPILGAILSFVGNLVVYAYVACVNVSLWTRVGGRIGTDIGGGAAPVS